MANATLKVSASRTRFIAMKSNPGLHQSAVAGVGDHHAAIAEGSEPPRGHHLILAPADPAEPTDQPTRAGEAGHPAGAVLAGVQVPADALILEIDPEEKKTC